MRPLFQPPGWAVKKNEAMPKMGSRDEPMPRQDEPMPRQYKPMSRQDEPLPRRDEPMPRQDEPQPKQMGLLVPASGWPAGPLFGDLVFARGKKKSSPQILH